MEMRIYLIPPNNKNETIRHSKKPDKYNLNHSNQHLGILSSP